MNVPYNYLPQEFEDVTDIIDNWKKLIKSSEYTLGSYVTNWKKNLLIMLDQNSYIY